MYFIPHSSWAGFAFGGGQFQNDDGVRFYNTIYHHESIRAVGLQPVVPALEYRQGVRKPRFVDTCVQLDGGMVGTYMREYCLERLATTGFPFVTVKLFGPGSDERHAILEVLGLQATHVCRRLAAQYPVHVPSGNVLLSLIIIFHSRHSREYLSIKAI